VKYRSSWFVAKNSVQGVIQHTSNRRMASGMVWFASARCVMYPFRGEDSAPCCNAPTLLLDTCTQHRGKLYTEAGNRNKRAVESRRKWVPFLAHLLRAWRDPAWLLDKMAGRSLSIEWRLSNGTKAGTSEYAGCHRASALATRQKQCETSVLLSLNGTGRMPRLPSPIFAGAWQMEPFSIASPRPS